MLRVVVKRHETVELLPCDGTLRQHRVGGDLQAELPPAGKQRTAVIEPGMAFGIDVLQPQLLEFRGDLAADEVVDIAGCRPAQEGRQNSATSSGSATRVG